ncbi:hypothetical protein [Reichenbachiella versicolor]|uniref:hypothetical protein n=1 Tax=Reichenbachiella versicolor TaxID=1821036 RepID=UPI000D6EACA0|nr:hypothetical protein [Reichenbachiella versicolor]
MKLTDKQDDNQNGIFYLNHKQEWIDTSSIFKITEEGGKLRVQNNNVNCLFTSLTPESFDNHYNKYAQHLNLDFEPLEIQSAIYQLSKTEQEQLKQSIITYWMYFYSVNNPNIKVIKSDFEHPCMVDQVLEVLDVKYGPNSSVSLALGAKILRQSLNQYTETVNQRKRHYDR